MPVSSSLGVRPPRFAEPELRIGMLNKPRKESPTSIWPLNGATAPEVPWARQGVGQLRSIRYSRFTPPWKKFGPPRSNDPTSVPAHAWAETIRHAAAIRPETENFLIIFSPITGCEFQIPQNARRLINV